MARTQTQIKGEITTAFMANDTLAALYGFDAGASFIATFSLVSLENILFDIVSFALFLHEQIFDQHTTEVNTLIYEQKSGRLPWYKTMALAFQFGFDLVTDHDYYDNTGFTDEQVSASKIVKYAAVGESDTESRVILKVATETAGELAPLNQEQKAAFDAYMKEVKWPGRLTVINYLPDRLYLDLKIQYDALVLNASGMNLLTGTMPVELALAEFMKELPFDGRLRLSALIDKLQGTPGVVDATLISAQSSWIDATSGDYGEPSYIDISVVPQSGYFSIETLSIYYYA